jgi:colanic acid/amylovoran biosynthesis glycosyltransferase
MKIAFILYSFPNLSTTFILNQITGLIDRGHDVDIYALLPGDAAKYHEDVERYRLLDRTCYWPALPRNSKLRYMKATGMLIGKFSRHPKTFLQFLGTLKHLKHIDSLLLLWSPVPFMRQHKYDIIHGHFGPNGVMGAFLRDIGILKGKLITTFHGYDVNRYQYGKDYYEWFFQHGDFYTANSFYTANRAIALGCPSNRIEVLPVGVDISKYSFRARTFHSGNTVKIITVARLAEEKGLEYSIRAIAKAMKSHPSIRYQIVGDGCLRESIKKLVKDLGIGKNVELLGWKTADELTHIYDNAHLFLLASVTGSAGDCEGQGVVLQEAQAAGLPVLSTRVGGIPEGIINGKSGFIVAERDVDALAKKLVYLLEHHECWPEMGRIGRKYVEDHYNNEVLNDRLVNIYKRLLEIEHS